MQIFREISMRTTLDRWSEICHEQFGYNAEEVHPIHSCVIGGKRHYIHAPDLKRTHPEYFRKLTHFAKKNNILLKEDQRDETTKQTHCRRRKLLPIMFLAFNLASEPLLAEKSKTKQTLHLFSSEHHETPAKASTHFEQGSSLHIPVDETESIRLERILLNHFRANGTEPESIFADIKELADYYSVHKEAAGLLTALDKQDWKLVYAPHTFQTNISGSRLNVDEVVLYFDPRSGAKLKFYDKCDIKKPFCVASPADALLHELLHAHTILLDTNTFIAQGGLNTHMYPAEHERKTILKENVLYKSMSLRDKRPRPIRSEHTGRHVLVSCVTCVE